MKKWLYPAAFLAVALLARMPHPAVDVARLAPVRSIYIDIDGETLTIETDDHITGSGLDLQEAYQDLTANADREIFLDTAEFLILDPDIPITEEFYDLIRPTTKVVYAVEPPDLDTISDYLAIHPPRMTLANLRPTNTQPSALRTQHEKEGAVHAE